ncbi:MAG: hypothetical protein VCA18_07785 [Opitutales bacterium]
MPDDLDVNRPKQCPDEHQGVALPDDEPFRHAQEVQSNRGQESAENREPPDALPQAKPDDRHDDEIEAGDESCLPRRGVLEPDLLESGSAEQDDASHPAKDPKLLPGGPRLGALVT